MGIFNFKKKILLKPKTQPGPESSLKPFPLLYLYFDDFVELQNAARQGALDIGMRIRDGSFNHRYNDIYEGILADEKRFLEYYQNNMLKIRLKDNTILSRKIEMEYWDKLLNPKTEARGENPPPGFHPRAYAELTAYIKRLDEEIGLIIESLKIRYGM